MQFREFVSQLPSTTDPAYDTWDVVISTSDADLDDILGVEADEETKAIIINVATGL